MYHYICRLLKNNIFQFSSSIALGLFSSVIQFWSPSHRCWQTQILMTLWSLRLLTSTKQIGPNMKRKPKSGQGNMHRKDIHDRSFNLIVTLLHFLPGMMNWKKKKDTNAELKQMICSFHPWYLIWWMILSWGGFFSCCFFFSNNYLL